MILLCKFMNLFSNRPDGQILDDVLAVWCERLGSNAESVKLAQVAIDLLPMQPFTVCQGASCKDEPPPTRYT